MLLSRVAGRIYWAARYIERAEDTARLVRAHTELMADLPSQVQARWEPLVTVVGSDVRFRDLTERSPSRSQSQSQSQSAANGATPPEDIELTVAKFLISDRDNPSSVVSASSTLARTCARRATPSLATAGTCSTTSTSTPSARPIGRRTAGFGSASSVA